MGEQDNGRNSADPAEGPAAAHAETVSSTGDGAGAAPLSASSVHAGGHRRGPARLGRAVQAVLNVLAVIVRLVACAFAVVLLLRIGVAFVAVNPHNVIVEWIVRISDVIVLDFRDLFLPADPRIALAVNYGLAAVFWLVVGMIAASALSGLGRLAAGRRRG